MANAEKQSLIAREVMAAADQDREVDMEDFPEADDDVWNFCEHPTEVSQDHPLTMHMPPNVKRDYVEQKKHPHALKLKLIPARDRIHAVEDIDERSPHYHNCLLYTSPSPRDLARSRMPSSA